MSNPLVSIIVPVFNTSGFLDNCIRSILNQTYREIEVILVDDGSDDDCGVICDRYSKNDDRVVVIHNPKNEGLVRARKRGILHSSGSLIVYVDSDDWVEPLFVESLYNALVVSGVRCVLAGYKEELSGSVTEVCKNSLSCGVYRGLAMFQLRSNLVLLDNSARFGVNTFLWGKLFYKEDILPFQLAVDDRITIGEDAACLYPYLMACDSVCIIDAAFYHYIQHPASMVKTSASIAEQGKVLSFLQSFLERSFAEQELKDELDLSHQLNEYLRLLARIRLPIEALSQLKRDISSGGLQGERVVLCGAGTFGQHLFRYFTVAGIKTVCWVDPNYLLYREAGLSVDSVESLLFYNPDKIIIAFSELEQQQIMKERIVRLGFDANQIQCL